MLKNFSLDRAMYGVVIALALFITTSTALANIAVAVGVLFIALEFFRTKKLPKFDTEILKVLAIYFAAQVFIAIMSLNPAVSFREVAGESHRFLPLIFAMTFIKSKSQLRDVLIVILITSFVNEIVGLVQYFILGETRAYGLNKWATFFSSIVLMQILIQIFISQLEIMPKFWRILSVISCLLAAIALIASLTRISWITAFVVAIIFIFMEKRYRTIAIKILSVLLTVFIIVLMSSPFLLDRFKTIYDVNFQGNHERVLMWESSLKIFEDYPLHGIGQNMFRDVYNGEYISEDAVESWHSQAHNNIINTAVERGIIGIIAFFILYGYFFRRFFIQFKKEQNMKFSAGLTAFLIAVAIHFAGLTETNLSLSIIIREFWFFSGILIAAHPILNFDFED